MGEGEGIMSPKERVVAYMGKHRRITLRDLALVAGVPLTDVKKRSFAKLIYDLRELGVVQVSTNLLRSEFVLQSVTEVAS